MYFTFKAYSQNLFISILDTKPVTLCLHSTCVIDSKFTHAKHEFHGLHSSSHLPDMAIGSFGPSTVGR